MSLKPDRKFSGEGRQMGRSLSWTQLSYGCGYQLKYHRLYTPRGLRSSYQMHGDAVHAGIQWGLTRRSTIEEAVAVGIRTFFEQMREAKVAAGAYRNRARAGVPYMTWDAPVEWTQGTPEEPPRPYAADEGKPNPRMTKGKPAIPPRPKAGEEHKVPDWRTAVRHIRLQVTAYLSLLGALRVVGMEENVSFYVERPERYKINCYLDLVVERDWIIDLKTGKPWDERKFQRKVGQARLYMAAYYRKHGRVPRYEFHILPTGTDKVLIYPVEYDPDEVIRMIEHLIRPTIATIEAEVFRPNTDGWWHDPNYCSYWNVCPLGAAASKAMAAAEDSHATEVA